MKTITGIPITAGPICYSCQDTYLGSQCNTVNGCSKDEVNGSF